jgi:general L-amino acid transport system substrate-binding protein
VTGWEDEKGKPVGMEPDIQRAIAAAIFHTSNPKHYIEWVGVSTSTRFEYLYLPFDDPNHIDVAVRAGTYHSQRDVKESGTLKGFEFGPIYFYDGTFVMMNGRPVEPPDTSENIVVPDPSSNLDQLRLYEQSPDWPGWTIIPVAEDPPGSGNSTLRAKEAFRDGVLNGTTIHGFSTDGTILIPWKVENEPASDGWYLYPTDLDPLIVGKSPLASIVKDGIPGDTNLDLRPDLNWNEVVRWVFYVLIEAEERGFSQRGPVPQGWLEPTIPGLDPGWSEKVIRAVGNYGEIWDRHLEVYYTRGYNRLWNQGGLLYAPPIVP